MQGIQKLFEEVQAGAVFEQHHVEILLGLNVVYLGFDVLIPSTNPMRRNFKARIKLSEYY